MRLLRAALLFLVASLLFPSAAAAVRLVPPGNSAANQYSETLPGMGGNEPTGGIGAKGGGAPAKTLGASNAARLEALGPAGRAAARLAAQGAPGRVGGRRGGAANPSGASGLGQILGQVSGSSDSGGMGLLLPLLIALAVLAAFGFLFARRRTAQPRG